MTAVRSVHGGRGKAPSVRAAIRGLWPSRWLLRQWIRRDFSVRYKQSALGVLWAVFQPVVYLAVYGTIFSQVLKIKTPGTGFLAFALCGLAPWTFVSSALSRSAGAIIGSGNVIRQVYFPRSIIPLASAGVSVIDLGIATVMMLVAQVAENGSVHLSMIALVLIYVGLVLMMAAVAVVASVIGALVRDISFVIPFLLQLGFIATPIMYPRSRVPHHFAWFYSLNPLTAIIDGVRKAVIEGVWPSVGLLIGLPAAGAVAVVLAVWYCASVEHRLPDSL